jgi:flagellar motility protein MotE (MotC chaperone)
VLELDEREAELRAREQAIDAMLHDMERRLGRILEEIEQQCGEPSQGNGPVGPSSHEDVARLSARVRAMSPERAAALLRELSPEFASQVLLRIGARDGGRILDSLPAELAAEIGQYIAAPQEEP